MDQRIKGQEVSITCVTDSVAEDRLDSISNFNDEVALELKEAGYLGEYVNRFDEILNGYGGDFEMNTTNSRWVQWRRRIIDRAQRRIVGVVFNVVRTDIYDNGDTLVQIYRDVKWGAMPTTIGSRGDYVKVKAQFKCSQLAEQINALI